MEAFSQAYQEETFIRLVEWAESQSHQWARGWTTSFKSDRFQICVHDLNTTSAVFRWCGWENVRHPSVMCQLPNCWADDSHSSIVSRIALTQAANNPWLRLLGNSCYWPHRIIPHFIMTRTKLWRVLDRRETFFWFRVSVSIERYELHSSFFLYISLSIKGEWFWILSEKP